VQAHAEGNRSEVQNHYAFEDALHWSNSAICFKSTRHVCLGLEAHGTCALAWKLSWRLAVVSVTDLLCGAARADGADLGGPGPRALAD